MAILVRRQDLRPAFRQSSHRRRLQTHPAADSVNSDDLPTRREWLRRGLIVLCGCTVALPLAIRGNSCGHDFDFHIQSWLAVAQQWRHGVFYPHWVEDANYGAGEPRFVFYPPLTWMLGALLGTVLPWSA